MPPTSPVHVYNENNIGINAEIEIETEIEMYCKWIVRGYKIQKKMSTVNHLTMVDLKGARLSIFQAIEIEIKSR
jgi:hypothetical protein